MVGGRRVRRPPPRFHRSNDDKFDTSFRFASEERVNEVHLELVAKFDSNGGSDRGRSEATVLLELRLAQSGHFGSYHGGNVTISASGTTFRGGSGVIELWCQLSKTTENEGVRCQSQVLTTSSTYLISKKPDFLSYYNIFIQYEHRGVRGFRDVPR